MLILVLVSIGDLPYHSILVYQLNIYISLNCHIPFSDKEEDIVEEGEERDAETAQEKRLRLAKQYLAQLESEGKS